MNKQLNFTVEIRQAPRDDASIKIIRCIAIPSNNWARLWIGELGKLEKNDDFSDCWERVYIDLKEYSGGVTYSTDPSLNVSTIPDVLLSFIIASIKDHHQIPIIGPDQMELFRKLQFT